MDGFLTDGSAPGAGFPAPFDPAFDAALRPPARRGVDSAWYGHVPFGHWIVAATRPRVIVELGTSDGVSYTVFCEAAGQSLTPTRCVAALATDPDPGLAAFHDPRYGAFSRLLPLRAALSLVADGSVDLLHVVGPQPDMAEWQAKLSDRAVVLLHARTQDEAWRHAAFHFQHAGGLTVLAMGRLAPAPVAALCGLTDQAAIAAVRARFATLGERWEMEERRRQVAQDGPELELQRELVRRKLELDRVQAGRLRAERDLQIATARAAGFCHERDLLLNSTFWKLTYPARLLVGQAPRLSPAALLRGLRRRLRRHVPEAVVRHIPRPTPIIGEAPSRAISPAPGRPLRIVYVSGEPRTPGHVYRVVRHAAAAAATGAAVTIMNTEEIPTRVGEVAGADLMVVWRAEWNASLARLYAAARRHGVRIAYDLDDMILRPELARVEVVDGIRSQNFTEQTLATMIHNILRAVQDADICLATTEEIAYAMRSCQKPAFVLPNGFDDAAVAAARLAMRARRLEAGPGAGELVRIGYAGGSRTHQRDFRVAVGAVARLLNTRPNCRLVLFCTADQIPLLDIEEYDELMSCLDQIEWREAVPVELLVGELARFDINLAPLEVGNPFCEAKSELKFFEAALAGVCTIASPTGPFARLMRHGETGLLAETEAEWFAALTLLADDLALRRKMAQAAFLSVLYPHGQQRREERVWSMLRQLEGGMAAGRAFALDVQTPTGPAPLPELPAGEVMFLADRLGRAEVSVVIPLYNYESYVTEALESVARQTLAAGDTPMLDLVVVDDCSTDGSLALVMGWAERNAHRFNRLVVLRNLANAGLGPTRNAGFAAAETLYILPLDADNTLHPECCASCLGAIGEARAAFAYPRIQCFGGSQDVIGAAPFLAARLVGGNYIDAMALVGKWAWAAVGGYRSQRLGWEDYEFWCRLVERGFWGVAVESVLANYRVHGESMLHRTTDQRRNKRLLVDEMQQLHPWLSITLPDEGAGASD